jgi:CheY-like chemotaxis protein
MASVLVVDDDDDIREIIEFTLRRHGHEVWSIGDPLEALALAATTSFDLAVLDWSMPRMDGGELCARLRELPHLDDLPVMVVTAHGDATTRERAASAGASRFVSKPFSLAELARSAAEMVRP